MMMVSEWMMNGSDVRIVFLVVGVCGAAVADIRTDQVAMLQADLEIDGADEDLGHEARRYAAFQRPCTTNPRYLYIVPTAFACECYLGIHYSTNCCIRF